MQQIRLTTGIIMLSSALFLNACRDKSHEKEKENISPVMITVATPGGNIHDGISGSGKIEAAQTANISTRMMGTITRIYVKVGDNIRKGQLLATISSQDIQAKKAQTNAAITEAEANLKNAQKDFERFTNLFNKQSASAKELDNVTLQYNAAKARVEAAAQMRNEVNAMMAYTSLSAPFDGTVTQRMADEGSMANPGMPLLTVEQNSELQVSATVGEADINQIKKGDEAAVEIKATGKKVSCLISEISPSSLLTGGQYLIKLAIPGQEQKGLYAGMYVNIFIPVKSPAEKKESVNTVLVPLSSLINKDQLTGLYTISSNNTALLRWVRTGKTFGDKIEILSGLSQNEKFIVSADAALYNGIPVKEK
ncbi:MAG TPA: efflux RND transporter periplasmic adaptor subunit [Chitinophagaceae bacterium]|nr:efflux RND transporter periplasmic adaptor subunit [Chitinophagaceae bacterium]